MDYLVTIGLEIHSAVNSKRKMFSNALNTFTNKENTQVAWLDLGLLGTLPLINLAVVHKAIQLGSLLNMQINASKIAFDRKNYFYYDLPKGYQITQYYHPIATNGIVHLEQANKKVTIVQIQIEEDTAKQTNVNNTISLDYNRSGSPLLEIVTAPDFTTTNEVLEFLTYLRRTLVFANISDGKIELGSLRVDVNVSVRLATQAEFNPKVEIKNIGSFAAVEQAINFEIKRQKELIATNQLLQQETRRWDEIKNQTIFMRKKTSYVGYYFMPEPNLPVFSIEPLELRAILKATPTHWTIIATQLKDAGLSVSEVNNLLDHHDLYLAVMKLKGIINDYKKAYKWLAIEIWGMLNKTNLTWNQLKNVQKINLFAAIQALEIEAQLNGKQLKTAFSEIIYGQLSLAEVIAKHNMKQITDLKVLEQIVVEILETNQHQLSKFLDNETKFEKFIIGQIMAKTKAQANPKTAKQAYINKAKDCLFQ